MAHLPKEMQGFSDILSFTVIMFLSEQYGVAQQDVKTALKETSKIVRRSERDILDIIRHAVKYTSHKHLRTRRVNRGFEVYTSGGVDMSKEEIDRLVSLGGRTSRSDVVSFKSDVNRVNHIDVVSYIIFSL